MQASKGTILCTTLSEGVNAGHVDMPCLLWRAVRHYVELGAGGEFLGSNVHVWDSSGSAHVMLHIYTLMKQSCS